MSPVELDPELIAKLMQNGGDVPLAGPDGKPVGQFLSAEEYAKARRALILLGKTEITEEDCRRALANPKRHTTAEVFKLLGVEWSSNSSWQPSRTP